MYCYSLQFNLTWQHLQVDREDNIALKCISILV